jgi:hypothetical protein
VERQPQLAGDLVGRQPILSPEHLSHADPVLGCAVCNAPRAGRAVVQPAWPFRPVAGQPLAGGALADAKATGHLANRLAVLKDAADHFRSTQPGRAGILVRVVHSSGPSGVRVATTTFGPSDGMNNLLRSHT